MQISLSVTHHKSKCAWCRKRFPMWACSTCKTALYCGRNCQQNHWEKSHRKTCCIQSRFAFTKIYQYGCYHCISTTTTSQIPDLVNISDLCGAVLTAPSEHNCMNPEGKWGKDRSFGFMQRYILDKSLPGSAQQQHPTGSTTIRDNQYIIKSKLGSGTFGNVYQAVDKREKVIAVKMTNESSKDIPGVFYHDLEVRNINHPNVVGSCYVGTMTDKKRSKQEYFVMFMDKAEMSLYDFIQKTLNDIGECRKKDPVDQLGIDRNYDNLVLCAYQCALGLGFINTRHMVATNDFKESNVLVYGMDIMQQQQTPPPKEEKDKVKTVIPLCSIADFGISRPYITNGGVCNKMYSLWWRSPEVLLGNNHISFANEIWALGCTIYIILTGSSLFPGGDEHEQLDHIFSALGTPEHDDDPLFVDTKPSFLSYYKKFKTYVKRPIPERSVFDSDKRLDAFSDDARSLLKGMMARDPNKRLTIYDVIDHPFFTKTKLRDTRFGETAFEFIRTYIPSAHFNRLMVFDSTNGIGSPKRDSIARAYSLLERPSPTLVENNALNKGNVDAHQIAINTIFTAWEASKLPLLERVIPSVAIDIIRCFFGKCKLESASGSSSSSSSASSSSAASASSVDVNRKTDTIPFRTSKTDSTCLGLAALLIAFKYANFKTDVSEYGEMVNAILGNPDIGTRNAFGLRTNEAEWEIATQLDFDIHRPCAYIYAYEIWKMYYDKTASSKNIFVPGMDKDTIVNVIFAISRSETIGLVNNLSSIDIAKLVISSCLLPEYAVTSIAPSSSSAAASTDTDMMTSSVLLLDPWKMPIGIQKSDINILVAVSFAIKDFLKVMKHKTGLSDNRKQRTTLKTIVSNIRKLAKTII